MNWLHTNNLHFLLPAEDIFRTHWSEALGSLDVPSQSLIEIRSHQCKNKILVGHGPDHGKMVLGFDMDDARPKFIRFCDASGISDKYFRARLKHLAASS
jgi:hypothetical protein